ncbi:gag-pre-integrs domain containing protein [Pyrenophora tritici-repentis]|nr:gag-pre-integrs domain containing protein [Pyrenophora tritici-repentis]
MAARSSQEKAPQTVTAMRAHQLLGHPSYQALEHLQDATTGLKIGTNGKGDPWTDDCVSCIQGKMKEDISRRPRADKACRPFYRISIDIIQLQEHGAVCYNGDVWALHAVCEYTKFHEICTLRSRHKATVVPAIIRLINKIERVYGYQVAIVFMDGDVGYGRAEAHLDLSRLHIIGSRGFILDKHLLRGDKLEKRTFEGFLIGYDASNIYRVWIPTTNRVIRVRDVRFIDELYKEKPSTTPVEPRIIETVHIPEEEYDGDTIVVVQPVRQRQEAITTPVLPLDHVSEKDVSEACSPTLSPSPTPAFEGQDRSPSPDPVEQQLLQESSALMDSSPHRTPGGWNNYDDDAEIYIPDRHQNNAPQRRDPNLSQDNIITGRRRRQAHYIEAALTFLKESRTQQISLSSQVLQSSHESNDDTAAFENIPSLPIHQDSGVDLNNLMKDALNEQFILPCFPSLASRVLAEPVNDIPAPSGCDITAAIQSSNLGDSRKQAVLGKISKLLSFDCQICLPLFWRSVSGEKERLAPDMRNPEISTWLQKAFQEPGGLNAFLSIHQILHIHRTVLGSPQTSIYVSELSLLLVAITWGALLDTSFDNSAKAALADAITEMIKLLLGQPNTINKFLALVAMLCLAETMGLEDEHALILGCVGTAGSLKLHMGPVVRSSCYNNEQVGQVEKALRMLYCIDKSYALRWKTIPLLSKDSLPRADTGNNLPLGKDSSVVSVELLHARTQYAHMCLQIVELRKVVQEATSDYLLAKITELATALDNWHKSITENAVIPSLEEEAARRVGHQAFCQYHEALLHLVSIYPRNQHGRSDLLHQNYQMVRQRSMRDVVISCDTISLNDLLQDQ